ncbi:YncE family protein [Colwelliaceae bacterium 6471]
MKTLIIWLTTLILWVVSLNVNANTSPIIFEHIVYLKANDYEIKRYSLEQEAFLSPIQQNYHGNSITAFQVDQSGLYIATGSSIHSYDLDGTNEKLIINEGTLNGNFEIIDNFILLPTNDGILSIDKDTGAIIEKERLNQNSDEVYIDKETRRLYTVAKDHGPASGNYYDQLFVYLIDENGFLELQNERSNNTFLYIGSLHINKEFNQIVDSSGNIFDKNTLRVIGTMQDFENGAYTNHTFIHLVFWKERTITFTTETVYKIENRKRTYQLFHKLSIFDTSGEKSTSTLIGKHQYKSFLGIADDKLYFLSNEEQLLVVELNSLFIQDKELPDTPYNLTSIPNYVAFDENTNSIFMFEAGSNHVSRWSITENNFLTSIALNAYPNYVVYSSSHNRIYFEQGNEVRFIDLATMNEGLLITLEANISSLYTAGNYLISLDTMGSWSWQNGNVINIDGEITDSKDFDNSSKELYYNEAQQRLFHINPIQLDWFTLDQDSGKFVVQTRTRHMDSYDAIMSTVPSEKGTLLATSEGNILDGYSFEKIATFRDIPTSGKELLLWHHNNIFSFKQWDSTIERSRLTRFQADYSKDEVDSYEVEGTPIALLPLPTSSELALIVLHNGTPKIYKHRFELKDFDDDGVPDTEDDFPTNQNLTKFLSDTFLPLEKGNKWTYNTGITAEVKDSKIIAGNSILPIEFSTGSKLYFDTSDNKLTFHGFYLPSLSINNTNYKVDLGFNEPVVLENTTYQPQQVGDGVVEIDPTYGSNSFDWQATVAYLGESQISSSIKTFDTVAFNLTVSATAVVDGYSITIGYEALLNFAPEVGLVSIKELGSYESVIESYQFANDTNNNNGSNNNSSSEKSSSGGGSTQSITLVILLLTLYRRLWTLSRKQMFKS